MVKKLFIKKKANKPITFKDELKNVTYFTIDPIDGTANFSTNFEIWGIQVVYIENNECKVSIDAYVLIGNKKYDIEPGLLSCKEAGAVYYRDNICTIVANSNELIDLLKEEIYKIF